MKMNKDFILSIKTENIEEKNSRKIILDKFESKKEAESWADWLKEVYKKVIKR